MSCWGFALIRSEATFTPAGNYKAALTGSYIRALTRRTQTQFILEATS